MAFDDRQEAKDILDKSEQEIFSVFTFHTKRNFIALKSALEEKALTGLMNFIKIW